MQAVATFRKCEPATLRWSKVILNWLPLSSQIRKAIKEPHLDRTMIHMGCQQNGYFELFTFSEFFSCYMFIWCKSCTMPLFVRVLDQSMEGRGCESWGKYVDLVIFLVWRTMWWEEDSSKEGPKAYFCLYGNMRMISSILARGRKP